MSRIFISYRRQDAADVCGRIFDHLAARFARGDLFKDVDTIGLGLDFRTVIADAVGSCDVVLVVIGPDWVHARDGQGRSRLLDPDDFVRIEVEAGLERDIPVIPVLVGGAAMPKREKLPESLHPLVYRNAIALRADPDFATDMQRLIRALESILTPPSTDAGKASMASTAGTAEPAPARKGPRKRGALLAALAVFMLLLAVIGYLLKEDTATLVPQSEETDPCAASNPPASCLFQ
jgi:hypothetical protein